MNATLKRTIIIFCLFCASIYTAHAATPLKIAFVLVGTTTDSGYNQAHNEGRLNLQAHTPNVQTSVVERVPENADCERVMEKLIAQGNKLIFSTSYGYLEPAERVAKRHPDVIFMQTWRRADLKNMGCYAAYQYQPMYAAGIVAGKMTKKNSVGFVCAHPVPTLLQSLNAFTMGARSVNAKVKVHVVWTNSWSDAPMEAEASKGLIESGVDTLGCILDSPLTVARTAEQNHIMVVGSQVDLNKIAPNEFLTGQMWRWDTTYSKIVKAVQDGTWKPQTQWFGLKEDAIALAPFGKLVPKDVQKQALQAIDDMKQGKKIVFMGPLKDREGKLRVPAGKEIDFNQLSGMDWFVDGVEGSLPKKN